MLPIPQHSSLPVDRLASIFQNVTNSYKFYWFLAILRRIEDHCSPIVRLNDISGQMLSDVWYPLDFYKLSFGKQDGFKPLIEMINKKIETDYFGSTGSSLDQITGRLSLSDQQKLSEKVKGLLRWVPYRFQRPFVAKETRGMKDYEVNKAIMHLANEHFKSQRGKIMYRYLDNDTIEIQPVWHEYLQENMAILRGFIHWELSNFLQKNNPNVIGITEKLFRPKIRNLRSATSFWRTYLEINGSANCIYSDQTLELGNLSIDHFIPWRYVVHDELWNLTPTISQVNSSKSDNLPSIDLYLSKFSALHFDAFHKIQSSDLRHKNKLLEDYAVGFRDGLPNINGYSKENFQNKLGDIIKPLHLTASNLGFAPSWVYGEKH